MGGGVYNKGHINDGPSAFTFNGLLLAFFFAHQEKFYYNFLTEPKNAYTPPWTTKGRSFKVKAYV
jgi:hypothetical protein